MGKFLKISICILTLLLILLGGFTGVYFYMQSPVQRIGNESESAEPQIEYVLKVPSGTTTRQIAEELESAGIIRSADYFYLKARLEKLSLKAGRYVFTSTMPLSEIFAMLVSGKQEHITVSIPEGLTVSKIATLLQESDVIDSAEDFIAESKNPVLLEKYHIPAKSAEGYLFPDTYFFTPSMAATDVLTRLIETFFERIDELHISAENPQELHETVILASIVEREYRREEEAPLIASVFANRLKKHIGLESCATIVYVLTEIEGRPHPDRITYEDLKINSTYNTYKWAGLPAGPISNPGKISLAAAANPPKTNYYYFRVSDASTGTHHFSSSLEEHAAAGRNLDIKAAAGGK